MFDEHNIDTFAKKFKNQGNFFYERFNRHIVLFNCMKTIEFAQKMLIIVHLFEFISIFCTKFYNFAA